MSLSLLLPEDGVTELLNTWPDEPRVFERGKTALDETVTEDLLTGYTFTGCVPANEIAVVRAPGPSLNQNAYMTHGHTDAAKLRKLYDNGYTIRLGNLQRVIPFMTKVSRGIQEETGFSNYIHAFLTPPGNQGLRHHWDQQMAVIVQTAGTKRWQLWRPPVEAPMREYNESWRVWRDHYIPEWEAAGPELEIDLRAGQSLLLPRGWVHNPHVADKDEHSVHLTFAIRERTPLWLVEKLVAEAIEDPLFRRIVLPDNITGPALVERMREVRQALREHLDGLDLQSLAASVRQAAITELEYTT
ncbi:MULTISPECIES: cupin domain-containing protein [Streptomyces]|uniref:Cupin domain-containing protein n=1 Tax=Streptomyces chengmaiensis TaxID=3040919 RepID=A0ABT6HY39_9ACTN|nr:MULTISPECIES: cupin domain-containing protein [Streptomyces]MDH2393183.1 cupin domain-containing protein [Streptomyces chengmaiensis]WRQ79186.1 cupin domain-containing protein [Streptomyces sp. MUM 178J]